MWKAFFGILSFILDYLEKRKIRNQLLLELKQKDELSIKRFKKKQRESKNYSRERLVSELVELRTRRK